MMKYSKSNAMSKGGGKKKPTRKKNKIPIQKKKTMGFPEKPFEIGRAGAKLAGSRKSASSPWK